MAKPELGTKRLCVSCGARFYDLGKVPAICPKCGTEQPADQPRLRRVAPLPEDKRKKVVAEADPDVEGVEVEVEDLEEDDDAGDDAVIEDTSDLEGDADDLGSDIEVTKDDPENDR
jgi:uncharacterized protein (TIGR02300 family)